MSWMNLMKKKGLLKTKSSVHDVSQSGSIESQEALRSLIENHPDAVCLFNGDGEPVIYNSRLLELTGFSRKNIPPGLFEKIRRRYRFEQEGRDRVQTYDDRIDHKDGNERHVQILHIPISANASITGMVSILKDISESVKTERTFTETIKKMRNIINHLDIAIWAIDVQRNTVDFCSDAVTDLYGIGPEDIKTDTWKNLIHPEDLDEAMVRQKRLLKGETLRHSYRIVTPKGKLKWVKDHTIPIMDSKGNLVRLVGFVADISETKTLQHKLHQMAYYDELTHLPNRYYGRETIREWIDKHQEENKIFALFYLNLDGLNRVNDAFGHEIGDEALRRTSEKIINTVGKNDVVCRIGGDEFITLIRRQEKLEDYYQTAQKLIDVTQQPMNIEKYDIYVTTSIGISIFPLDSKDYLNLVKNARNALSRAKGYGKANYQVYAPQMDIESFKLFQLESDLRKAVENKELYLEYQPRIHAIKQQAVGAEALIRWNHPTWGVVSPAEFIPLAEENSGIIQKISEFVVRTACEQIKKWKKEGTPFSFLSLNLSAKNFLKDNLVDQMEAYMNLYSVSPEFIEIEITESSLLQSAEVVGNQIGRLKEMGVRIALDDYGTGYSSIHYLRDYPVDTIKIDRSFVQKITGHEEDAVIVKSIIDLAKGLRKKVVAEGVETREQFDLLKKYRCDEIQGYLFSKSISGDEMGQLFLKDIVQLAQQSVPATERRQYYRIDLPLSLSAQLTILSISGKDLSLGSTEVLIQDIGLGGLRFISHLRLRSHQSIVYGFETNVLGTEFRLNGKIVWGREMSMDVFEYGVEFMI
ncbi:MAG TPA: EAL domain-containing protein, partial [Bacillales bacterium]|nr:EAL domain-containing protein [Bacillales bacterium]